MSWWFPFQITITGEWIAAFSGLAGVVVGFWLENIRNRKNEKRQHRKFMIRLRAEIDSASMQLVNLITELIIRSFAVSYNHRRYKKAIELKEKDYKEHIEEIETGRIEFNDSVRVYQGSMEKCYRHLIEFMSYVGAKEAKEINEKAIEVRTYFYDKYNVIASLTDEQIAKFDYAREIRNAQISAASEFSNLAHELSVLLGKEIEKLN